jgi:hypothetical protein
VCINLIAYDKEEEEEGYGRISGVKKKKKTSFV